MTLETFKIHLKIYRSHGWIAFGFLMLGLSLAAGTAGFVSERVRRGVEFDAIDVAIVALASFAGGAIIFFGADRYPRHKLRQLGLACPTCGKFLVGPASHIVIATGRCGFCGGAVSESAQIVVN